MNNHFDPMFKPKVLRSKVIGYEYSGPDHLAFFGNRYCEESDLAELFPQFTFKKIRQVHGINLVQAQSESSGAILQEADAHWTSKHNVALLISTADCLPILISAPDYVCAIHAGWRGVLSDIVSVSLRTLAPMNKMDSLQVYIGPHIGFSSFEVDTSLAKRFEEQSYALPPIDQKSIFQSHSTSSDKSFVHLANIVRLQMLASGLTAHDIYMSSIDTVSNEDFYSYRREKKTGLRNFSFIARRKP